MEPFAVVSTVASIGQLAHAALTLSKTLYDVSSTIASAKEDITNLADDLKTFSQSLSLLSRLLEDSKAWYSDDIYLLTAKIIRDCADLYGKIDKILLKLGYGKSGWKFRIKFVYKENQIKKLMERLRDMKGTLATILMSLQVDLQLSLLNISSSSKIQRPPEKSLHPETIRALNEAQLSIEVGGFLPVYAAASDESICGVQTQNELLDAKPNEIAEPGPPVPELQNTRPAERHNQVSIAHSIIKSDTIYIELVNVLESSSIESAGRTDGEPLMSRSIKSSTSTESFKSFTSAISMQSEMNTIESQTKSINNVIHAFKVALETLDSFIGRRLLEEATELYPAISELQISLREGVQKIEQTHGYYCKLYGYLYIESFSNSDITKLENINVSMLKDIVTLLHIHSAPHQKFSNGIFQEARKITETNLQQTIDILTSASESVSFDPFKPDSQFWANEEACRTTSPILVDDPHCPLPSWKMQRQDGDSCLGYAFDSYGGRRNFHIPVVDPSPPAPPLSRKDEILAKRARLNALKAAREKRIELMQMAREKAKSDPEVGDDGRTSDLCLPFVWAHMKHFENSSPDLMLPFIGYTFKRFEVSTNSSETPFHSKAETTTDTESIHGELGRKPEEDETPQGKHLATATNNLDESLNMFISSIPVIATSDVSPLSSSAILLQKCEIEPLPNPDQNICDLTPNDVLIRTGESLPTASSQELTLNPAQTSLWQTSYTALESSYPEIYMSINHNLSRVFGQHISGFGYNLPQGFCANLAILFKDLKHDGKNLETADQIINIALTIHEKLGFRLGNWAWSCVYALLKTLRCTSDAANLATTNTTTTLLTHLLEITGLIARYSVMENLYRNIGTGADLTLESTYQDQLVELCMAVFTYFHSAFSVAESLLDLAPTKEGVDAEDGLMECGTLMLLLRKMDMDARGFRILVEWKEVDPLTRCSDDDESEESEEGESGFAGEEGEDGDEDEKWERIEEMC